MVRRINLLVLSFILPFLAGQAYSWDTPNLHLLAITSGHFSRTPAGPVANALPGAHVSGQLVLRSLAERLGATTSILVRSDESRYVSRQDVFDSLHHLAGLVDGTPGPDVAIVYIMSHGYGDGIAWNYFLQPGNVGLFNMANEIDINRFGIESLAENLISVSEVVSTLKAMDTRYVLLVDACYEGEAVKVELPLLSNEANQSLIDVQEIIIFMNEFHDPDPVVFSAHPGSVVRTVEIPNETGVLATLRIGPLARRLLLALNEWDVWLDVTERILVETLLSPDLDTITDPAVSFAEFDARFAIVGPMYASDIQVVWGTAGVKDFYELATDAADDKIDSSAHQDRVSSAFLVLDGPAGEWVSDGGSYRFKSDDCPFVIDSWGRNEISLTFCNNDGDWSLSFAVPNGERFARGTYSDVVRYPFQIGGEAALAIAGDGRGCNEVAGEFTMHTVEYVGEDLVSLAMSFSQVCDSAGLALTGRLAAKR